MQEMQSSISWTPFFKSLNFCTGIADDMIIWGKEADVSYHDKYLTKFLQDTRHHNLKLNLDELQLKTIQVSFFATTFTSDGHKPGDNKVQAFNKMAQPTNVSASSIS